MDDEPADHTDALDATGHEPSARNGPSAAPDDLDDALTGLVDGYEPPTESGPDVWAATTATAVNPLGADTILAERDPESDDGDPPARTRTVASAKPPWRAIREWLTVLVVALGAAVLIRVFVFQQYYIDGPSMEHTLEPHDRVLVNKLSYRLHDVNRGDVVVFDRLSGVAQHDDLIKRVIALPGETVSIENCIVFIDGQELEEPYLSTENQAQADPSARCRIPTYGPEEVPDDQVFVMGDNRPQSFDSREFGPIEIDQIRGRAFVVIWPFSNWTWL
jgi:signal peptidase I